MQLGSLAERHHRPAAHPENRRRNGRRLRGAHRDAPVRNLIREGRSNQLQNIMFTNTQEGMQTMETSLAKLIVDGVITYEDAMMTHRSPEGTRTNARADWISRSLRYK